MTSLDRTLTYRLHLLHKLTDVASQRAYLSRTGLALSDARCLTAVGAFAPLSVSDLAQKANLDKGQASRAAQSLAEQGLVRKTASQTDGRGVLLALTPKGRKTYGRAMEVVTQRNDDIFKVLGPAGQALLSQLFDQLIAHARAQAQAHASQGKS